MTSLKTTIAEKAEVSTIENQIASLRNLDGETSKPKLKTKAKDPLTTEKVDSKPSETKPQPTEKPPTNKKLISKPQAPPSTFQSILTPYLRTPLQGFTRHQFSTFVPSSHMMYYIVHLMDDVLRKSHYFRRDQDDWHPFISRLYFGILFIIQTLRAQNSCKVISNNQAKFLTNFLKMYPPESLKIPGPLATLFQNINYTNPSNQLEGPVTPVIPDEIGPATAGTLLSNDDDHIHQYLLPNIPLIMGFINTILSAPANAIPDYSSITTFNNEVDRIVNGHLFQANNWNQIDRDALMTPGLLYLAESDVLMNQNFNLFGKRLNLPVLAAQTPTLYIKQFMCMNESFEWFGSVQTIMGTYCSYFAGSSSLAECTQSTSVSPLITTDYVKQSAPETANNYGHLTHGFPNSTPFSLEAQHSTTEVKIAPAASMIAQSAQLNVSFQSPFYGHWNRIGVLGSTRIGPYWEKTPILAESVKEKAYLGYSSIIKDIFSLSRPLPKQD